MTLPQEAEPELCEPAYVPPASLHEAAALGDMHAMCEMLVAGASPSIMDEHGLCALHEAILTGRMEALVTLLAYGADPDMPTSQGQAPLHLAVESGSLEAVQVSRGSACRAVSGGGVSHAGILS